MVFVHTEITDKGTIHFCKPVTFEVKCSICESDDCVMTIVRYNQILIKCQGCGNEEKG